MENNQLELSKKRIQDISLAELNNDLELAFKNDVLKSKLNSPPNQKWLKPHPSATKKVTNGKTTQTVPAEYLPIDKIEFLLDYIFQEWKVEVLREGVMFNSINVTVRVHYKNPINGEWLFHDGVGAKDIQLDAGADKTDFSKIKSSAVMMALPTAKSYAIKDACDHLGTVFGRNVNRADSIEGQYAYSQKPPDKSEERLILLLHNCKTRSQLNEHSKSITTIEQREVFDEMYKILK